ncbi:alpha/beta fold hydrolase [Candidatus Saccharibacteria bacterium]|nr:alpha/beta fold hydrolase [Candidatus Saccharibacteria bacterium]
MRLSEYVWHRVLRRPYRLKKIIDQGSGDKVIILIHGLGAKAQQWRPLVRALNGSDCRIIAYDLLGFGSSPKPKFIEYSVEEHSRSLLKSIKKDLGSRKKIIVVGHSMGCIISTNLAYNNPELINKLVLYEPPILASTGKRILVRKSFYEYIAGRPALVASYLRMAGRFTDKFSSFKTSNASDEQ